MQGRPDIALNAAAYVRVSLKRQAKGESPEVQRAALRRLAAELGVVITMTEEDHERGGRMTRTGYQRILEAARRGEIGVVLVYTFSRWGRNAAERLTRGEELDRLGVAVYSMQQGRDEPGIKRAVFAGVDEEYSRSLARAVTPAREAAARKGRHMGPTFIGYRRLYPAWDGDGKGVGSLGGARDV